MVDPVIKAGLLAAMERQVNGVLALDPVTSKKLSRWFGKVVMIQCSSPPWLCFLHIEQDRIRLTSSYEGEADATFTGSSAALAILAIKRHLSFDQVHGLVVSGYQELIDDLQAMHRELDIDWERPLGQAFGEIPGHTIARGLRWLGGGVRRGQEMVMDNLGEYLQEELRLIPSRVEMELFASDVQQLAQRLDQLAQRQPDNKTDGKSRG